MVTVSACGTAGLTSSTTADQSSPSTIVVATTISSPAETTSTPPPPPTIEGTYRGKVFREDEPGTPLTFHLVEVDIKSNDGSYSGTIAHGPVGADTLEDFGKVDMPLDVKVLSDTVVIRWDVTTGPYEDGTFAQCVWHEWEMEMRIEGDLLVLESGHVKGQPPEKSDVGEWWAGCPDGVRDVTRATLVRQ